MAVRFVCTIGRFRLLDLVFFDIDDDKVEEEGDFVRLGSTHEAAPSALFEQAPDYEEEYGGRAFGFGKKPSTP